MEDSAVKERKKVSRGRTYQFFRDHPRANSEGYVSRSILIAEKALGKPLPKKAIVHHVNEDPSIDSNKNLVICQDQAYHMLIHARTRIVMVGGCPSLHKICSDCKQLKNRSEFANYKRTWDQKYHLCFGCSRKRNNDYYARKKCLSN